MLTAFLRKYRQVQADPVLRRWLIGRAIGRWPGEPAYQAHRPPYAADHLPLTAEEPRWDGASLDVPAPDKAMIMPLPGSSLTVAPGDLSGLFDKSFVDTEALLGLHRFAWLPWLGDQADPVWVDALWRAWCDSAGTVDDSWAWHPYTAAERAINILRFAHAQGLPGDRDRTLGILAAHAPAIAQRLEYFGDHHTGNHLCNNGRGLFLLGLGLGLPQATELGALILLREAERILMPSGVLREGSSHYHLLLTRNLRECATAARAHRRPEADDLDRIVARMLAVLPHLNLPGGLPLIGDISPDAEPALFADLLQSDQDPVDGELLRQDGWLRADFGPWSGLWHAAPEGWSHMPGHGHQDLGSFELHHEGNRVFVDPGRGAYGEEGEAALYRSARAHNGLLVDGADPYAANKPYYNADFRQRLGGEPPTLQCQGNGIFLRHDGFGRLKAGGSVTRSWIFEDNRLTLRDEIGGMGVHKTNRLFHTALPVERDDKDVIIGGYFRLSTDQGFILRSATIWEAYGRGRPGTCIDIDQTVTLPTSLIVRLEVLD
ncbi:conserved membrane protein of unknown function [Magnetospira sp. QH-2]|nr:conserved membrane protein of unknown function [Magnetospira sp. QH-2]